MNLTFILSFFLFSSCSLFAQTPGFYPPSSTPYAPRHRPITPHEAIPPPTKNWIETPGAPFSNANAAAMHFLNIVDNQVYHGAWLESGSIVHDVVPQDVWAAGMRAVRAHKGIIMSRTVVGHRAVDSLPGGLTGEIMIIEFETHFSNGSYETETLTLMTHPPAGTWRVISYRIGR